MCISDTEQAQEEGTGGRGEAIRLRWNVILAALQPGSVASRAESMDKLLRENARGRELNFVAHSMGGLDCRHLITHVKPEQYTPVSLTTVCTPHRGSPFMDWCAVCSQSRIIVTTAGLFWIRRTLDSGRSNNRRKQQIFRILHGHRLVPDSPSAAFRLLSRPCSYPFSTLLHMRA